MAFSVRARYQRAANCAPFRGFRLLRDRVQAELGLDARNTNVEVFDSLDGGVVDADDFSRVLKRINLGMTLVEKRDYRVFKVLHESLDFLLRHLGLMIDERHRLGCWLLMNVVSVCHRLRHYSYLLTLVQQQFYT